jgi:hypothetical protein
MSTYQSLKGLKVKFLSAATTGDRATEGEIFYNSGGFTIASHIGLGAWSAGSSLSTGRTKLCGSGTQTASFAAGGLKPAAANETEEYNGSGWGAGGNLNTARSLLAAAGSQTAGLAFGGIATTLRNESEEYNGSSWTEGDNLNTARRALAGAGTQTAGLAFGGSNPTSTEKNETETYNGSSWTEVANLNDARDFVAGLGTQTAALCISGESPSLVASVESWDGSSWTEVGDLNTARFHAAASGTTSAGLAFGGQSSTAVVGVTESWDGTSWTELADLSTAREHLAGSLSASNPATLAFGGGDGPPFSDATEEFNISTSATTAAAWASGNNLNTARRAAGTFGTQTAAVCAAGSTSDPGITITLNSESYDGTSWTEGSNQSTGGYGRGCFGVQTAGVFTGGYAGPPGVNITETETYDGSSYSTSPATLNAGRSNTGHCGISTAGLLFAGPPDADATEEWNGSAWSNGEDLATGRNAAASFGTQTAAVCAGGRAPPPAATKNIEEYDGTDWTSGAAMSDNHEHTNGGSGLQTDGLVAGNLPASATTEGYDGTSWSTRPSMGTAVQQHSTATQGTSTAALVSGGGTPPGVRNNTQEFTGDTTVLRSAKTIDFD